MLKVPKQRYMKGLTHKQTSPSSQLPLFPEIRYTVSYKDIESTRDAYVYSAKYPPQRNKWRDIAQDHDKIDGPLQIGT